MYEAIAKGLTGFLLKAGAVPADKAEIYAFGFEALVSRIGTIFFLLLGGLILGAFPQAVVYYFVFLLSRKYAGGYHATTYVRCNCLYVSTFALLVGLERLLFYLQAAKFVAIPVALFACFTVWRFAPLENPNNPFAPGKAPVYRRRALLMTAGLAMGATVLQLLAFRIYGTAALTMGLAAGYMYVEIIKNRREEYFK